MKLIFILIVLFAFGCTTAPVDEDPIDPIDTVDCLVDPLQDGCEDFVVDCYDYPTHSTCEDIVSTPPTIQLETTMLELFLNDELPDLTAYITAFDSLDNALTITNDMVDVSKVRTNEYGEYPVTIEVEDYFGNVATATLFIVVSRDFTPILNDEDDGVIYYITTNNISPNYSYYTALRTIQGHVNKNQPNLMIINPNNSYYTHTDTTWKEYLKDEGYTFIRLYSYIEVVMVFSNYFEYAIEIDDSIKSYNQWVSADADFSAMISSITGYLPIPKGLSDTVYQYTGITLTPDFEMNDFQFTSNMNDFLDSHNLTQSSEIYDFVFTNFKALFNSNSYMSLTSESMDYAVKHQMMFFDLRPTYNEQDEEIFTRLNEYFRDNNDYYSLYGWVDQESHGLQFLKRHGGMIRVLGTGNLSLYDAVEVDYTFNQAAEHVSSYDETKKYITFIASEADTLKAPTTFQQGAWLDEFRGSVPINWGLIANTTELFPIVAKYYYDTASPNDYFFSGGSSSLGFVDIDTQMPHEAMLAIAADNRRLLDYSDQHFVDTYNDLYIFGDIIDQNYWGTYFELSGYKGAFGIDPTKPTGPTYMKDTLFYNRRDVFYPRAAHSALVTLDALQRINLNHYRQTDVSDYWYLQTTLNRATNHLVEIDLFRQANNDRYMLEVHSGALSLYKVVNNEKTLLAIHYTSLIGQRDIRIAIDNSSSVIDETSIIIYLNKNRVINITDSTFTEGGFALRSDEPISNTFLDLKGKHLSQANEIYEKIINSNQQFIVGYYGVVWDEDFTRSQYKVEPGPGEVISMSPTSFYKIKVRLEEEFPGQYDIVNMDEFYDYLTLSENRD